MKYITGELFQSLCGTQLSIEEFMPFEAQDKKLINVYDYDFKNSDKLIYINNDLIKGPIDPEHLNEESKQTLVFDKEINIFENLKKIKNRFSLILHNNDSAFEEEDLKYFTIKNLDKIYAQNVKTSHPNLIPLPIGIGNSCWPYGDLSAFDGIKVTQNKTKDIYFNFTIEGGCRDVKRPKCFNRCTELGIPWIKSKDQKEYLKDLSQYKFIISPEGNGIDCHRTWEALYLKVVPIVDRNVTTEYFSKYFPMVLIDDWNNFKLDDVLEIYESADWSNYYLLDFDLFIKKFL